MKPQLPFRLGSTSYVYPADILPNVRKLAPIVDDIELVLFEVDSVSNLPSPAIIAEMSAVAAEHDLTYTVHLPLDLRLASGADTDRHHSVEKARRVVEATRPLHPWAYVVHLDGSDISAGGSPDELAGWREQATRSLELVAREAGDPRLLAVENLENYSPEAFLPLIDELGVSLCADVGHFIKLGDDPQAYLMSHVTRTRIVHLHGSEDGRDHRSLHCLPEGLLRRLLDLLVSAGYSGVTTIEVFSEQDFLSSREMILSLVEELE